MKKPPPPPRLLADVIQAIYELAETGGSTTKNIVNHIESSVKKTSPSVKQNLPTEVKRALNEARTSGILKQRAGKFRLNSAILDPLKGCAKCKKGRKRKHAPKRRRKRSRKHKMTLRIRSHSDITDSDEEYGNSESETSGEDLPVRQVRRKRRSSRIRKRRRRRRGRRERSMSASNSRHNSGRNIAEELRKDVVYPDDYPGPDQQPPGEIPLPINNRCDNSECLCNVKEEAEIIQNSDDNPDV